jgi:predicted DCC family thiol-disulfide oxidoreductase YuxK
LLQFPSKKQDLTTILYVEKGVIYDKSTAILKICRKLNGGYPLFYGFILIPKFIRDWIYEQLANKRYQWFGKKDQCMAPSTELKDRFL